MKWRPSFGCVILLLLLWQAVDGQDLMSGKRRDRFGVSDHWKPSQVVWLKPSPLRKPRHRTGRTRNAITRPPASRSLNAPSRTTKSHGPLGYLTANAAATQLEFDVIVHLLGAALEYNVKRSLHQVAATPSLARTRGSRPGSSLCAPQARWRTRAHPRARQRSGA